MCSIRYRIKRIHAVSLIDKFNTFKENRKKKKIASYLKVIQNPKAIKEDRFAAIEYFSDLGIIDVAIPGLLKRFEYSLEHGINDTREKEAAVEGIKKFGVDGLPYLLDHIKASYSIAWPLKIYKALATKVDLVEALEACLDYGDVAFDQKKVDKNYDILCYLRFYALSDHGKKILHFLNEHDERLRFAATEALLEQNYEDTYIALERFVTDDSNENRRIRQAVIEKFAHLGRTLVDQKNIKPGPLVSNFFVTKKFKIQSN